MSTDLLTLVIDRLLDDESTSARTTRLVDAALHGPEALDRAIEDTSRDGSSPVVRQTPVPPRSVHVAGITVEGFRGIGQKRTLEITPGPGLTLVVGRNGSGKSSFAEALELLLT